MPELKEVLRQKEKKEKVESYWVARRCLNCGAITKNHTCNNCGKFLLLIVADFDPLLESKYPSQLQNIGRYQELWVCNNCGEPNKVKTPKCIKCHTYLVEETGMQTPINQKFAMWGLSEVGHYSE